MRRRLSRWLSHLENRTLSAYWQARAPHVLPVVRVTDDVLEVGSGAGVWAGYLATRVASYTALEIDPDVIEQAKAWRAPVRFVQGDAQALPFADRSFDTVLMVDAIEHIPDDALALREVARVLRTGGRFVLTTLREDRPSYLRRLEFDEHDREYDAAMLRGLCTSAGLRVEKVFDFYRAPMMLARELAVAVENSPLRPIRWPFTATLVPLMAVERLAPFGRPGGIGVRAVREDR